MTLHLLLWKRGRLASCMCVTSLFFGSAAAAQPAPTAPPPSPPPAVAPGPAPAATPSPAATPAAQPVPAGYDTVALNDGRVLWGRVLQQAPGSYLVLQYTDGSQETIAWKYVRNVSVAARGAAPPPAGQAGGTGVDPRAGTAGYNSQVDCSRSPDERCQQQSGAQVGRGGAGFGMQGQSVQRLEEPPSYHIGFDLSGYVLYGKGTGDIDMEIVGGSYHLGIRSFFGSQLPGAEGGSWSGVGIHGLLQGGGGNTEVMGQEVGFQYFALGGNLGYQYFSFGELDQTSLEQNGIGLFAGWRFAVQNSASDDQWGDASFGHGPTVSLSFPSYNAGTTSLRSWTINGIVLLTGDIFLLTVGGGYAW